MFNSKKHKEKLKEHKNKSKTERYYKLVRNKQSNNVTNDNHLPQNYYIPKPMDTEEAIMHMTDRKVPFLVFRNFQEEINVVYEIDKENVGLIEP